MSSAATPYPQIVNVVRLALEQAGDPAYALVSERAGGLEVVPVIYAGYKPALAHAERLAERCDDDVRILIVRRQTDDGERVVFDVLDHLGRTLHRQFEVVERSVADEDTLL